MQLNHNSPKTHNLPTRGNGPYLPLTEKEKFQRGFLFRLPDHPGIFQLLEDRNGRDYISRCICGRWQYDYAIELVGESFIAVSQGGHVSMFFFDELCFDLA